MQTEIESSMQAQAMQVNSLTATTPLSTEEIISGNFNPSVFGGYKAITRSTVQDAEVIEDTKDNEQVDVPTEPKSSLAEPDPVSSITTISLFRGGRMNDVHRIAETEKDIMDLWHGYIHDESISILFADTNVGKSILAVQICNEIAHSYPTEKVVYFDFEMTDKQRQLRYHTDNVTYQFEENLHVYSIQSYTNSDDSIVDGIVSVIKELSPKVICVDNLKAIFGDVEKGKECKEFLMRMKQIKDTYNCTIILINHTNKSYKKGDPLNLNMMAGSKNIANFADEILAVGASHSDDNIVYVKQLKTRASAKTNTVAQYTITKCDNGNLVFAYNKQTVEQALLKTKDELEQIQTIKEMLEDGKTIRQIATALNMSSATVGRRVQMIKQQEEQEDNDE